MARLKDLDTVREIVRRACDLVEVIESYGHQFSQYGSNHKVTACPFHSETEPSFAVHTDKQVYMCYGCKEGGDVFTFVQKTETISFIDAVRWLARWADVDLSKYEAPETPEEREARRLLLLNSDVAARAIQESDESREYSRWRVSRVLQPSVLETYGIGYSAGPWAPPKKASTADAKALGLKGDKGAVARWTDVVVVPLFDDNGNVAAFRNRALSGEGPKTITVNNKHPLPIPPIYGFYQAKSAIRKAGRAILVEGEVDVWQMVAHGYENTCGTYGTNLSEELLDYLHERGIHEVIVMPDADDGGRKYAQRVARTRHKYVSIKLALIPTGDPDDLLLSDPDLVKDALDNAIYGIEYLVKEALNRDLFTLTQKYDALKDLKDDIGKSTRIEVEMAVGILAEALSLDPVLVADYYREGEVTTKELHDIRAERSVLSKAIQGGEFTGEVVLGLKASDFYTIKHQHIHKAIDHLYRQGQEINSDTVGITLERMGYDQAVDYVSLLDDDDGASSFMLDVLKDKSSRRKLSALSRTLAGDAANPTLASTDVTRTAMNALSNIVVGGDVGLVQVRPAVDSLMQTIHERVKNPNLIVGYDLGKEWQTLNRTIHGLQLKRYFVFAAPSGVGKTTAAVNWVSRLCVDLEIPTLVLTFETARETWMQRLVSYRSGVQQENIITGYLDEEQLELIHTAASEISASPLVVTERGQVFEEAQALIQHDVISRGTKIIVVDYVQLMNLANAKGMSRHLEVGNISRGFLEICNNLDVTVIALVQINREGTKKGGAADHTDVGDAYKLAQDAMIFATLTEKTKEEIVEDGPEKGNRRLLISKNRSDGASGVHCYLDADMPTQRIKEVF